MAGLTRAECWPESVVLEDDATATRHTIDWTGETNVAYRDLPDGSSVVAVRMDAATAAALRAKVNAYGSVLAVDMDAAQMRLALAAWAADGQGGGE